MAWNSKWLKSVYFEIVTVKFKPEVSEEIRQEALRDVCDLKNDIPEIISASAGKNFTDRSKGYEYGR